MGVHSYYRKRALRFCARRATKRTACAGVAAHRPLAGSTSSRRTRAWHAFVWLPLHICTKVLPNSWGHAALSAAEALCGFTRASSAEAVNPAHPACTHVCSMARVPSP